jgi:phosphatidylserine decarboxylase
MVFENERATIVIERDDLEIAVVLIASRLVRRIRTFVRNGEFIGIGDRIGAITFGSQVDIVFPSRRDLRVAVKAGDRLVAAESIIATIEAAASRSDLAPGRDGRAQASLPAGADP